MLDLHPVTAVTIGAAFVFGMVLALLGSLKLALARRLDLGEGGVGSLFAALNLAFIPMMILSGIIVDKSGVTGTLVFGSFVTAVALFSLALRPTYTGAFVALLIAGLGSAGVSTASIVLMPHAFFGPGQTTASLNLGNVFFALGALVTPPLTAILLQKLEWRRTLGLLGGVCLVPAILAALFSQALNELATMATPLSELLGSFPVWVAGLVFFFYAPLEGAISVWTTTYLTGAGHSEKRASWLLSGFWAAFLLSRLLVAFAQHGAIVSYRWDKPLLVVLPLLAAVVLGNLAGTGNRNAAWRGTIMLGFLLGPIFPTLVSLLFKNLNHEGITSLGTAYGLMFAVGSLGSLMLSPLIGAAARKRSVQVALRIPMFMSLILSVAALVFCLLVETPHVNP